VGEFDRPRNNLMNIVHEFVQRVVSQYKIEGPILDIGAGAKPLAYIFEGKRYDGLDLENADIIADAHKIPLEANSYPTIVTWESLEHMENPFQVFAEMARILSPGGHLVLSTVWQWPIHKHPTDYWRFTSDCIKMLMERNEIQPLLLEQHEDGHVFAVGIKQLDLPEEQLKRIGERIGRAPTQLDGYIQGIYRITRKVKPEIIVELGTNMGDSTFAFLCAIQKNGKGHIWTVDSIDYNIIQQDILRFNWGGIADVITSDSVEYSKKWDGQKIDLFYIDTAHTYELTMKELDAWMPFLKPEGTLLLDDFLTTDVWKALFDWIKKEREQWNKDKRSEQNPFSEISIISQDKAFTNLNHTIAICVKN